MFNALIILYLELLIECLKSTYFLFLLFVFSLQRDEIFEHVDWFDFDCFFILESIVLYFGLLGNRVDLFIAVAAILVLADGGEDVALGCVVFAGGADLLKGTTYRTHLNIE